VFISTTERTLSVLGYCKEHNDKHEHLEINEEAREARWVKMTAAYLAVAEHADLALARQIHATTRACYG
jgi:hypothetical protein